MQTAAVILNWNRSDWTTEAAESVRSDVDRVYVVDNASEKAERESLRRFTSAAGLDLVELETNLGYAAGNNAGIERALDDGAEAVLVLNNDAAAEPGAVALLARRLEEDDRVGVVAPAVVGFDDRRVQHTACSVDRETGECDWSDTGRSIAEVAGEPRETGYVSGEAFLARASVFRECGAFDERFVFFYEDTEWSVRVAAQGWRLEVAPRSVFRHRLTGSINGRKAAYYQARSFTLFLVSGLGKSPGTALRLSARVESRRLLWYARRGHLKAAFGGTLPGWIAGILARWDRSRPSA